MRQFFRTLKMKNVDRKLISHRQRAVCIKLPLLRYLCIRYMHPSANFCWNGINCHTDSCCIFSPGSCFSCVITTNLWFSPLSWSWPQLLWSGCCPVVSVQWYWSRIVFSARCQPRPWWDLWCIRFECLCAGNQCTTSAWKESQVDQWRWSYGHLGRKPVWLPSMNSDLIL